MVDLPSGLYTAVSESQGYLTNFVKFAVTSTLFQGIKPFPILPKLEEGQLALLLTWSSYKIKDLDLNVEFIGSPTISCKVDFTSRSCGGVKQISDASSSGESAGSDVILFE